MDQKNIGDTKPATYSPLALKDCVTELKRQALERLLSAVYKRDVTLMSLLKDANTPQPVLEFLTYRGMGAVTDKLIGELRKTIGHSDKGERLFQIAERYFGLDGNMPARLSSLATKYGVSRERIRQVKERCLTLFRGRREEIESALFKNALKVAGISARRLEEFRTAERARDPSSFRLLKYSELLMMDESSAPFTFEQKRVLDIMNSAPRIMVAGCAGSGKTALAMTVARKLSQSGQRTLLTCFNKGLAETLTNHLPENDRLVVMSFHALCLRLGRAAGVTIPGGWGNHVWVEKFPEVLRRAMLVDPSLRFDAIVVDDAHDFRDNWWTTLEACLKDPMKSRVFCFLDDNLFTSARMGRSPDVDLTARLSVNLRNPHSVSSLLSACYSIPSNMRFVRENSYPPEFYRCDNSEELLHTLTHVFTELVENNNYFPSDIVVITPRSPRYSSALNANLRGKTRLVRRHSLLANHALLTRPQTFHGLERRVAIVVDLDEKFVKTSPSELRNFVYGTFSRYTDRLIIMGCKGALETIEALHQKAQMEAVLAAPTARDFVRI